MNKVTLLGRLTKNPDVRYTTTEKCVAQFILAVDRPFAGADGKKEADFIPCVAWGKYAELIGNSCQKGHRLLVDGRLQIRQYDDKNGQRKWATEVIVSGFDFIERKEQPKDMASMGTDVTKEVPFDEEVPF